MARKPATGGGMNVAVLRMEGDQSALDKIAKSLSLTVEQAWKKGDTGRNGRRYLSSGASVTVADAPTGAKMVAQLHRFLTKCKRLRVSFVGLRAEISVGISAGGSDQFVGSMGLS